MGVLVHLVTQGSRLRGLLLTVAPKVATMTLSSPGGTEVILETRPGGGACHSYQCSTGQTSYAWSHLIVGGWVCNLVVCPGPRSKVGM